MKQNERISLNGSDWTFKGFYGQDWLWRHSHEPTTGDFRHWQPAAVPGSVVNDLWRAGEVPDPYFERNSLLIEWVPARTWLYKRTFRVDESLRGRRIRLYFKGVDYDAQFFLNGERLGTHRSMYTPAVFEIDDKLKYGEDNLIAVVIEPAPFEQPQVGQTSLVRTHKSRMTYWWDFSPRMVHQGIWDEVFLEVTGSARLDDVFARTVLAAGNAHADVKTSVTIDSVAEGKARVESFLRFEGRDVARFDEQVSLKSGKNQVEFTLPVEQPRLWWPNGSGGQPLYELETTVSTPAEPDNVSDRRIQTVGIRSLAFAKNENTDPNARPYVLVVNGQRTYINGWNWVPIDVMYGVERPEKLERLLTLAKRANVNLLRVWGGGLIEKDSFYDLCDRLGILVWQEFIQSSSGIDNNPCADAGFIEMLVGEAEVIVPLKRNHASLAIWCGGNELSSGADEPCDDTHAALEALKKVVTRLDPDALWLATSPLGRYASGFSGENPEKWSELQDAHGPWEHQGLEKQYRIYNAGISLLHSEFGAEGITNLRTLNRTISPEHQTPVNLNNLVWFHLGAWWVKEKPWREMLGDRTGVLDLLHGTQFTQAEGLRYALEADRRRQYQNSGTLPWQFNEPYPMAACTSAVDYYAQPKPLYYAVAKAYRPVTVTARFPRQAWAGHSTFEAQVWVSNAGQHGFQGCRLVSRLVDARGKVYQTWEQGASFPADDSVEAAVLRWDLAPLEQDVFFLDLQLSTPDGAYLAENRYVFTRTENLSPLYALPSAEVRMERAPDGDGVQITVFNEGKVAAIGVWLEDARPLGPLPPPGFVYFSDNYFHMLPGESRVVRAQCTGAPDAARQITVSAWNMGEAVE